MRLILVRHGKPDETHTQRAHDPSLASIGQTQAKAVAKMLARETITHFVSSPLQRAMDTAAPLAESIGQRCRCSMAGPRPTAVRHATVPWKH
jgi:probable phosphoglycerate mutase